MRAKRSTTVSTIAILAIAGSCVLTGCGQSAKPGENAQLTITRDFGQEVVLKAKQTPVTAGLTAMRQLKLNAAVKTTYGGKFVNAIAGVEGNAGAGTDWLFYVNGIQSETGAVSWRIKSKQKVQWDFHQWRDITTSAAIVGAYPQPMASLGAKLVCKPISSKACAMASKEFPASGSSANAVTVAVGEWDEIARIKGVPDLIAPAAENGAFAAFIGKPGSRQLQLLGNDGEIAATKGAGTGLIAAARSGKAITWVVTGTDAQGVERAASLLRSASLENSFAVAATGTSQMLALPIVKTAGQ